MSKIVVLVHEHPNETPITRFRATQVKKILQAAPYNHQVEIKTFHNPVQPQAFANELSRAKTKAEAIRVLEKYLRHYRKSGYGTNSLLLKEASRHPGVHVLSFHGSYLPTSAIPKARSVALPSFDWVAINEFMHSHNASASSFVFHEKHGRRMVAVVENTHHAASSGKAYDFAFKRWGKCMEHLAACNVFSPLKSQAELREWDSLLDYLKRYTLVPPSKLHPELQKVGHAQALAQNINKNLKRVC